MDDSNRASSYLDEPANSRLFLVTSKSITEEIIREHFTAFGEIQDIWVVKDKQTKESKGVAFVKFSKSSQACTAMEEMHGRCLAEGTKPIKVVQCHTSPHPLVQYYLTAVMFCSCRCSSLSPDPPAATEMWRMRSSPGYSS